MLVDALLRRVVGGSDTAPRNEAAHAVRALKRRVAARPMLYDRQTAFLTEGGAVTARLVAAGERSFMPGAGVHPGPFALVELFDPARPSSPYGEPLRSYGDVELEALHRAFGHDRFSLPLGRGRVLAPEHVVALFAWLHAHDTERLWSSPQQRHARPHS